jgi:hypothetical protein
MSLRKVLQFAVLAVLVGIITVMFGVIPHWSDTAEEPRSEPDAETIKSIDPPKEVVTVGETSRPAPGRASISQNSQESLIRPAGITIVDGRASIVVENRPIRWVLEAIAKQTGIMFNVAREVEDRRISVQLHDVSIEQALRSLLTDFDVFFYVGSQSSSPPSLRTVWVYPQDRGRTLMPLENRTDVDKESIQVESDMSNDDKATTEALVEMVHDDDPTVRVQGLSALADSSETDDATVRSTLAAALLDPDASVRAYAVQALGSRGGEEAMEHLWEALSDPDPSVRVMAVETVDPRGQGITLLEVAASDSDETVRSTAKFRLEHAGSDER